MNVLIKSVITVLMLVMVTFVQAKSVAVSQTELERVKQHYQGQSWVMLLWSVDCPPCFKELATIKKLKKRNPKLNIVLINADGNEEIEAERQEVINHFELAQLTNLHFSDGKVDQSRYLIDPHWYGELPRSYFFDSAGESYPKSGLISESLLTRWLIH